jgi:hypothetical protein
MRGHEVSKKKNLLIFVQYTQSHYLKKLDLPIEVLTFWCSLTHLCITHRVPTSQLQIETENLKYRDMVFSHFFGL